MRLLSKESSHFIMIYHLSVYSSWGAVSQTMQDASQKLYPRRKVSSVDDISGNEKQTLAQRDDDSETEAS